MIPARRRLLPLILPLSALPFLISCQPVLDPAVTLTVAIDSGPSSLDPRLGSDEASKRVNELMYNGLFRVDESARPVPDLAAAVERPDDRTVIVTLRDDVRFQDGARLEARDVVATYRSILDDEVPSFRKGDLSMLAEVSPSGERSVVFRLKQPFAPILINLAVPIQRAGAGPEAARHPIGTGPFRLIHYRKDEDILLERFDGYFGGAAGVRWVHLKIIPSETGRLLELLKGSADLILNDLSPDQLDRVRRTPGYQVETMPGRNCVYMVFNLHDPILADRRVREAIARAIDRSAIIHHLLHDAARPATGLLPPSHWAYEAEVPRYDFDPYAAALLLDRAGYPDPDGDGPAMRLRVTYKTSSSELALQQATVIQEQLARVGIGLDIRAYEWPTFYDDLKAGRFQLAVSNWTEISDPDIYRLRFHSRAQPPGGFNRGGYVNPAVDRLIEDGDATLDEAGRRRIYAQIQRLLAQDLPTISLWHRDVFAARRIRVRHLRLTPGADFTPFREISLEPPGIPASGDPAAENPLDRGDRHGPHPDHPGGIDGEIENGGGRGSSRGAGVQDQIDLPSQGLCDFGRGRRRSLPRAIGARGDDRSAHGTRQRGGHPVGRDPDAHRPGSPQQPGRERGGGREHQGERPRPEGRRQGASRFSPVAHASAQGRLIRHDDRQRQAKGTSFGLEDALDRTGVERIGAEPVEGLRRIGDQAAGAHHGGRVLDRPGRRLLGIDLNLSTHGAPFTCGAKA